MCYAFGGLVMEGDMAQAINDVTRLLADASRGDSLAAERLMPLVHDQLRDLAARYLRRERPDHTLQATALVNEAYLKLVDQTAIDWKGKTHFLAIAARAMRQVLVDHARKHKAVKHGGGLRKVQLAEAQDLLGVERADFSHITEAVAGLTALDERLGAIVELRFFGGLTNAEIGTWLGVSEKTVQRQWRLARAWLRKELSSSEE